MQGMRICYVSSSTIPSLSANSVQVMKMCQAFAQLGHSVELINPDRSDRALLEGTQGIWDQYGVRETFPIHSLPVSRYLKEYDYAWGAARYARVQKPDLLFTRNLQTAAFAAAQGVPTCLELHEPPARMGVLRRVLFNRFMASSKAQGLIVISEALKAMIESDLSSTSGAPVLTFHDGIDLERFESMPSPEAGRERLGLPRDQFTAVYCGHLYAGRGVEVVFALAKKFPSDRFLLIGGKPDDVRRCEAQSRELSLQNVEFTGFVANSKLPEYFTASNVLLMPYQRKVAISGGGGNTVEWMSPLKMFEYMAASRPILTSELPVLREVLDDDCAIFCEPDQHDQWAAAYLRLKSDPALAERLSSQALEKVKRYSWKARVAGILKSIEI